MNQTPAVKDQNFFRSIAGLLILLSGGLVLSLGWGSPVAGGFLLLVGFCFLAAGLARPGRFGESPESAIFGLWADERSKRIGVLGISYAWLTALLVMFALFWLDALHLFRLGTPIALALSIAVMILSARLYQMYLFRRGDR